MGTQIFINPSSTCGATLLMAKRKKKINQILPSFNLDGRFLFYQISSYWVAGCNVKRHFCSSHLKKAIISCSGLYHRLSLFSDVLSSVVVFSAFGSSSHLWLYLAVERRNTFSCVLDFWGWLFSVLLFFFSFSFYLFFPFALSSQVL